MTTKVTSSTLANTAVTTGTYGGTTQHAVVTVDQQGRVTYAANATPSIANTQITGTITGTQLASGAANTNLGFTPYNSTNPNGYTAIPAGVIVMWSGSIVSIPSGWTLCNGSNSTPDLRDRFVVGAGSSYAVASTGGSADAVVVSHTHTAGSISTVTDPGHFHGLPQAGTSGPGGYYSAAYNQGYTMSVGTNSATTGITVSTLTSISLQGVSATNANLPPYYALAYIMKT